MDIKNLTKPLTIDQIDFRIQSINNGGYATILAYKDARVDINRLNDICGQLGWKREHSRDNHNCTVSIWNEDRKHWVSKEDTGTESMAEAQKGLASDSFKRACFNWGIGLELYDYPRISVKLFKNEYQERNGKFHQSWELRLDLWRWESSFKDGLLDSLKATDYNGRVRFQWNRVPILIGETSGELLDVKKIQKANAYFRSLIDSDSEDYDKYHEAYKRLSNDEYIAVINMFGSDIPVGAKRQYKNILADILSKK